MKIDINNTVISVDENTEIARGAEGIIHRINQETLLKLFKEQNLNNDKIYKVLALCDKNTQISNELEQNWISSPIFPAYKFNAIKGNDNLKGFTMNYFNNAEPLKKVTFNIRLNTYGKYINVIKSDKDANKIIEAIFSKLQILHRNKIIIGDVNLLNILIDITNLEIYFIDVDSYQIGDFSCATYTEEYINVSTYEKGKTNNQGYHYSTESDLFAITVLCFELITGFRPFVIGSKPFVDIWNAQKLGINLLSYHYLNTKSLKNHTLIDTEELKDKFVRLDHIKKHLPELYMFFVNFFHHKKRQYYQNNISKKTNRRFNKSKKYNSSKKVNKIQPVRGYQTIKKDPIELKMFLEQFNIKTDWLCI